MYNGLAQVIVFYDGSPFKMFRIVPLGLFHMNFKLNSSIRASSVITNSRISRKSFKSKLEWIQCKYNGPGVIVAHLIATLYLFTNGKTVSNMRISNK